MATYEKVVGLLGVNLASFLELAKKLLIDWAIEPKKLLHLFQNIRKEDLIGLIDGTHEIKAKAVEAKPEAKPAESSACCLTLVLSPYQMILFTQHIWLHLVRITKKSFITITMTLLTRISTRQLFN